MVVDVDTVNLMFTTALFSVTKQDEEDKGSYVSYRWFYFAGYYCSD